MARGHGRISSGIWDDPDFVALTEQQQRLYLFLISQSNLNHAGLLPLTLRRWSRKAAGLTADELEEHLHALASARFVLIDEDTEELLIRTFVRNDGVWKQPRVMGAMVSGALEIESRTLRAALVAEMDRIPLDELSDEPTKGRGGDGPSIRAQVVEHITTLRKAFGSPTKPPRERGSATPSDTPSGTPSDTPDEGGREGSTRARAGAPRAHSPAPAPTPNPSPVGERGSVRESDSLPARSAEPSRPDGRPPLTELPDEFELTGGMRRWAAAEYPRVDVDAETEKFVLHRRGEGTRRRNWYVDWQKWITQANQHINKHGPNVVPFPGQQGAARPSTTDQRVQDALDLGRRMQAEADAAAAAQHGQEAQ